MKAGAYAKIKVKVPASVSVTTARNLIAKSWRDVRGSDVQADFTTGTIQIVYPKHMQASVRNTKHADD